MAHLKHRDKHRFFARCIGAGVVADNFSTGVGSVVSTLALLTIVVSDVVSVLFVKFVRNVLPCLVVSELGLPIHQCIFESDTNSFEKETVLHAGTVAKVVRVVQLGVKEFHAQRERLLRQGTKLIEGNSTVRAAFAIIDSIIHVRDVGYQRGQALTLLLHYGAEVSGSISECFGKLGAVVGNNDADKIVQEHKSTAFF